MVSRKVTRNGKEFGIVVEQLRKSRYIARVDCENDGTGYYLREPDFQVTDAESGETTNKQGQLIEFDTKQEAFDAVEDFIKKTQA